MYVGIFLKLLRSPTVESEPRFYVLMLYARCRGSKSDSRVGVGMERQGPSYGEVVNTRDVRVQALLGGSNSPTSRSPEAVEWIMNVWITRCRTPLPVEGGGLYRVRQDPSQPT